MSYVNSVAKARVEPLARELFRVNWPDRIGLLPVLSDETVDAWAWRGKPLDPQVFPV